MLPKCGLELLDGQSHNLLKEGKVILVMCSLVKFEVRPKRNVIQQVIYESLREEKE